MSLTKISGRRRTPRQLVGGKTVRRRGHVLAVALVAAGWTSARWPRGPPRSEGGGRRQGDGRRAGRADAHGVRVLGGRTFAGGFGDEEHPKITGGVYLLKGGKATKVPGSPPHVFGLAASGSTLYVSDGRQILAWSGWNGNSSRPRRSSRPARSASAASTACSRCRAASSTPASRSATARRPTTRTARRRTRTTS